MHQSLFLVILFVFDLFVYHREKPCFTYPHAVGRLEITSRAFGWEGHLEDLPTLGRRRRIAQTAALYYVATVLAPAAAAAAVGQKLRQKQNQGTASTSASASAAITAGGPWDGSDLALMVTEYRHGQRHNDDENNDLDHQTTAMDAVIHLVASILDRITAAPLTSTSPSSSSIPPVSSLPETTTAATTTAATSTATTTTKKKKETTLADRLVRALMACAKGPPRDVRRFLGACCQHQKLAWQVLRIAKTSEWNDPKCHWVNAVLHTPSPSSTAHLRVGQVDAWDKIELIEHMGSMIDSNISMYYDEGTLAGTVEDEDCLKVMNDFFAAGVDATMFEMVYELPPPKPFEEVSIAYPILSCSSNTLSL